MNKPHYGALDSRIPAANTLCNGILDVLAPVYAALNAVVTHAVAAACGTVTLTAAVVSKITLACISQL